MDNDQWSLRVGITVLTTHICLCLDQALVFWESSMYVQVRTPFGLKLQVQVSPQIQLYLTPPANHVGPISGLPPQSKPGLDLSCSDCQISLAGLCGNSNNDTRDDFTTSSGIIENSAQAFALSWTLDTCTVNIPNTCINTDYGTTTRWKK